MWQTHCEAQRTDWSTIFLTDTVLFFQSLLCISLQELESQYGKLSITGDTSQNRLNSQSDSYQVSITFTSMILFLIWLFGNRSCGRCSHHIVFLAPPFHKKQQAEVMCPAQEWDVCPGTTVRLCLLLLCEGESQHTDVYLESGSDPLPLFPFTRRCVCLQLQWLSWLPHTQRWAHRRFRREGKWHWRGFVKWERHSVLRKCAVWEGTQLREMSWNNSPRNI